MADPTSPHYAQPLGLCIPQVLFQGPKVAGAWQWKVGLVGKSELVGVGFFPEGGCITGANRPPTMSLAISRPCNES